MNFFRIQALALWLVCLGVFLCMSWGTVASPSAFIFWLCACIVQACLFTAPVYAVGLIPGILAKPAPWLLRSFRALQYLLGVGCLFLVVANYKLESMYGFFIDSFVVNLVVTPGGIEAMGASKSSYVSLVIIAVGIALLFLMACVFLSRSRAISRVRLSPAIGFFLLALFGIQGSMYAVAEYKTQDSILVISDRLPWYLGVTAKSLLASLNMDRSRAVGKSSMRNSDRGFNYLPAGVKPVSFNKEYNVVWLVAESWRWDMLTPEIMPRTYEFAQHSYRSLHHYSSGNGTRMGLFGQFYGIPGRYWFNALKNRTPPLIIDSFQHNDYAIKAYTSAKFSYPEFDKTIFSNIPSKDLQSFSSGEGWERDRKNVSDLIAFTKNTQQPFFTFMFLESAHANYYFPDDTVIRDEYLPDFDYLTEDIAGSINLIKNRYINSNHHLDQQFGRIIDSLRSDGLLANTIVIITGDHGEEFMENGRWGHNSTFSEQQIRVPLILYLPGNQPRVETTMTSHMDLPATVLTALAGEHDSSAYSSGANLMAADYDRDYAIISDWHGDAVATAGFKHILSPKARRGGSALTRSNDQPVANTEEAEIDEPLMRRYLSDTLRFLSRSTR